MALCVKCRQSEECSPAARCGPLCSTASQCVCVEVNGYLAVSVFSC